MNDEQLEQIVNAVLYEGYILYPYRLSSRKNQRERFTFGRVYPEPFSAWLQGVEPSVMQTEVLFVTFQNGPTLSGSVRFLQPLWTEVGDRKWQEATERRIDFSVTELGRHEKAVRQIPFRFPPERILEPDPSEAMGNIRVLEEIQGAIEISAQSLGSGLFKLTVQVLNLTPMLASQFGDPDAVIVRTFTSTHTVLRIRGGDFVSMTDPAPEQKAAAAGCVNLGTWPVLVGDEKIRERNTMLSSPIILYDYPQIARESAGPLFDGTEIDEILTLRVLAMSDDEKSEIRSAEIEARRLLERTETIKPEGLLKLHGRMQNTNSAPNQNESRQRAQSPEKNLEAASHGEPQTEFDDFFGAAAPIEGVCINGEYVKGGSRVRLKPKERADAFDLALAGRTALVESVQQDMEGRTYFAVVLEDDPGKDLGLLRQPGHRFFYATHEIELLSKACCEAKT